jgi:uncharacterized protein
MASGPAHGPTPPVQVRRPVMVHHWLDVVFLHWRYDVAAVRPRVPAELEIETHDGGAWVGLVTLSMRVSRPPVPVVPWLSVFPEINVRTYVLDPDGRPGVWFFSLDAGRLVPVLIAQAAYGLPYRWSAMSMRREETVIDYRCRRYWPAGPARCELTAELGEPIPAVRLSEFDHYLTARFTLLNHSPAGLIRSQADHQPWPLHTASLRHLDSDLLEAAGLPSPSGEPIVHGSPGVRVQIGPPHRLPA